MRGARQAARAVVSRLLLALACAQAGAAPPRPDANGDAQAHLAAATSRCLHQGDLLACHAALSQRPNSPELLVAEGDALVHGRRPGEAIGVYRNALRSGASASAVDAKVVAAQAQRQSLLVDCQRETGASGERACEAAWLPGAADEVSVFKRRGLLQQADGHIEAALDAYMAAARLAPHDRVVARAIVDLTEATARTDAGILTARGAALMTLGRMAEAAAPLRHALRLAPGSAEAKARLRSVEQTPPPRRAPSVQPVATRSSAEVAPAAQSFSNVAPATRTN